MKFLVLSIILLCSNIAMAQTYVQVNGLSWHDKPGYNEVNYGGGLEHVMAEHWSVSAGWYRNSEYHGSTYAYGRYAVYKNAVWDIGIAAGAVTGYRRANVLPMAFPEACYRVVCAMALPRVEPGGAAVLGLRLRIPIN